MESLGRTAVPTILLVDDNDSERELARLGFRRLAQPVNLLSVGNGEECLRLLRKEGSHAGAPTPELIMLDLNMPCMDGRQVLRSMREDPALNRIRRIVFSTSDAPEDIDDCYALGCHAYVVKPIDFASFEEAAASIVDFWFGTATGLSRPDLDRPLR